MQVPKYSDKSSENAIMAHTTPTIMLIFGIEISASEAPRAIINEVIMAIITKCIVSELKIFFLA